MAWINAPVCEKCWIEREGNWETEGDPADNFEIMTELRLPVRLAESKLESCHFCEEPTFVGIYQRVETP